MSYREDNQISDALLNGTEESTELRNMVWSNIQKELNLDVDKKENVKAKKNRILSFTKYGSIAAAVVIFLGINTQYGHAAVSKIKDLFLPSKVINQQLEGMDEKSNVALSKGSTNYIIYIDEERYTMSNLEGKDKITAKAKAENAPEVFMEIQQITDQSPEILASQLEKELMTKYSKVQNRGTVNEPVNAVLIYANNGSQWNSTLIRYYLLDNTKGGTFIIKQQFFVEAEEGHGVRLDNMLKEFEILNE